MTDKPDQAASERSSMPFEAAMKRLAEIVDELEGGELGLEESLALFEEGGRLAKHCQALLDRAEARIEVLLGASGGELRTEPLTDLEGRS